MSDEQKPAGVLLHEVRMSEQEGCGECRGLREAFNRLLNEFQKPAKGQPYNPCLMDLMAKYLAAIWEMSGGPPGALASMMVDAFIDSRADRLGLPEEVVRTQVMMESLSSVLRAVRGGPTIQGVPVAPDTGKVN